MAPASMGCTARYEHCNNHVVNKDLKYCQPCLDMEIHYHRRRRFELQVELEATDASLARLGAPVPRFAATLWSAKKGSKEVPSTTGRDTLFDCPKNGLYCELCKMPQYDTPSGALCENGHGGVAGIEL